MPYKNKEVGRARKRAYNKKYNPIYKAAHKEEAASSWKTYYEENKEQLKAAQKQKYRANPLKYLIYAAKARAEKFGLDFDLTEDSIAMPEVCPVFGKPFIVGDRNLAPSLDRIDPKKGYVKGNVAIVSFRANRLKMNASLAELKQLVAWLESVAEVAQTAEQEFCKLQVAGAIPAFGSI